MLLGRRLGVGSQPVATPSPAAAKIHEDEEATTTNAPPTAAAASLLPRPRRRRLRRELTLVGCIGIDDDALGSLQN